jgi:hypothetical protein
LPDGLHFPIQCGPGAVKFVIREHVTKDAKSFVAKLLAGIFLKHWSSALVAHDAQYVFSIGNLDRAKSQAEALTGALR